MALQYVFPFSSRLAIPPPNSPDSLLVMGLISFRATLAMQINTRMMTPLNQTSLEY
jgi:hypothetical protein